MAPIVSTEAEIRKMPQIIITHAHDFKVYETHFKVLCHNVYVKIFRELIFFSQNDGFN